METFLYVRLESSILPVRFPLGSGINGNVLRAAEYAVANSLYASLWEAELMETTRVCLVTGLRVEIVRFPLGSGINGNLPAVRRAPISATISGTLPSGKRN